MTSDFVPACFKPGKVHIQNSHGNVTWSLGRLCFSIRISETNETRKISGICCSETLSLPAGFRWKKCSFCAAVGLHNIVRSVEMLSENEFTPLFQIANGKLVLSGPEGGLGSCPLTHNIVYRVISHDFL